MLNAKLILKSILKSNFKINSLKSISPANQIHTILRLRR